MTQISKQLIVNTIDKVEWELRACFEVVAAMNAGKRTTNIGQEIVGFQPRLLRSIIELEDLYRAIKGEQRRLISRKLTYNQSWFAGRMAKLAAYLKALNETLAVARAIGDGFAYFFYARDRDLIDEHLKQQRQPLLPPGAGGLGERLTLERLQGFDGKFLLYHGLTTFLRLGDVTFYDMSTARIAYVAELKTKRADENIVTVEVAVVASSREALPTSPKTARIDPSAPALPQSMRQRQKRQIKQIGEALGKAVAEKSSSAPIQLQGAFHFAELDAAIKDAGRRDIKLVQAGPSLLIGAVRLAPPPSMASALFNRRNLPRNFGKTLPAAALKILGPDIALNALLVGTIGSSDGLVARAEALPIASWPAQADSVRAILFSEVAIVTLFNPAHFWSAIRERGFELTNERRGSFKNARRVRSDGKIIELENFRFFENLIPNSLLTLESVLEMVDQTIAKLVDHDHPLKAEFKPRIM